MNQTSIFSGFPQSVSHKYQTNREKYNAEEDENDDLLIDFAEGFSIEQYLPDRLQSVGYWEKI